LALHLRAFKRVHMPATHVIVRAKGPCKRRQPLSVLFNGLALFLGSGGFRQGTPPLQVTARCRSLKRIAKEFSGRHEQSAVVHEPIEFVEIQISPENHIWMRRRRKCPMSVFVVHCKLGVRLRGYGVTGWSRATQACSGSFWRFGWSFLLGGLAVAIACAEQVIGGPL
jgi:hypothetical protein